MFWDRAAGVYDVFANFINAKTHKVLCEQVAGLISPGDDMPECTCGTGLITCAVAPKCHSLVATDFSMDASYTITEGRTPCALAVINK